ncbi:SRPBCC family protein [Sinomonas gamaensis]|uniref:SRPBCC family protein n=1 Tax=Sinomonas gamaensis TaxID=2565624 RepID=UPI0011082C1D|nr:SRPBCC domain-containing protein [Sinomonas gamaensis]
MPFVSSTKDLDNLTLTLITEHGASPDRLWQVWEDARQLERWWGPPTWPATFTRHEFEPGGESRYFMTGPDGERAYGWWRITEVEAPRRLEFDDGFAGDDGEPLDRDDTTHTAVRLEETDGITRMTSVATFKSLEQLEKLLAMGMEEGMREAVGQIDGILAGQEVR